jgi:hypothetical protein
MDYDYLEREWENYSCHQYADLPEMVNDFANFYANSYGEYMEIWNFLINEN